MSKTFIKMAVLTTQMRLKERKAQALMDSMGWFGAVM